MYCIVKYVSKTVHLQNTDYNNGFMSSLIFFINLFLPNLAKIVMKLIIYEAIGAVAHSITNSVWNVLCSICTHKISDVLLFD